MFLDFWFTCVQARPWDQLYLIRQILAICIAVMNFAHTACNTHRLHRTLCTITSIAMCFVHIGCIASCFTHKIPVRFITLYCRVLWLFSALFLFTHMPQRSYYFFIFTSSLLVITFFTSTSLFSSFLLCCILNAYWPYFYILFCTSYYLYSSNFISLNSRVIYVWSQLLDRKYIKQLRDPLLHEQD